MICLHIFVYGTDLSFQIIHLYNSKDNNIATAFNERGMTPLHVLASKPSAFKSGTNFRWWKKLMYYCKFFFFFWSITKG